jgi:N6-adenosine-specific RNA methylase IME4
MQHELLLFGVKGKGYNVRTDDKTIGSWIDAPRGKHSQKPEEFRDLIMARSKGPYLEMFARTKREGWTAWGNEIKENPQTERPVC